MGDAFRAFKEMCTPCHGAPGKERGVIGKGLQPPAPDLSGAAQHWKRAELFWVVKNGIKMTGMPAFGPTHSDDEIWLVVAFLQRLPNVNSAEYKQFEERYSQDQSTEGRASGSKPADQPQAQGHRH
jgi:mono/diheme cytochrome c family protein